MRTRRPPGRVGSLAATALLIALVSCNDKPTDGDGQSTKRTTAPLVPYEVTVPDTDPAETDPPETDPPEDEASDTQTSDTETSDSETSDTESEVKAIDPMPGDTATFDTRAIEDPLCAAAQEIVDANDKYQDTLAKAIAASTANPDALVKAMSKLPLERIRNAYDDLAAELPTTLRRKVATIRDFTLAHAEELAAVEDLDALSELIAAFESDPDAAKVTKATLAVSKYTEEECGIKISEGR